MTDIWWYFGGFLFMASVVAFGFWMLMWSIKDLQAKLLSLSQPPPEKVKYVFVTEKVAEKVNGNELNVNTLGEPVHKGPLTEGPSSDR
jgi:hypothetical protein